MGQKFSKLADIAQIISSLGQTLVKPTSNIPPPLPTVFGPSARDVNEANRQIQAAALERQALEQQAEQFAVAENAAEQERLQKALEFEKTQAMTLKLEDMKTKRSEAAAKRSVTETKRQEGVKTGVDIASAEALAGSRIAEIQASGAESRATALAESLSPQSQEGIRQSNEVFNATMIEFEDKKKLADLQYQAAFDAVDGVLDVQEAREFAEQALNDARDAASKMPFTSPTDIEAATNNLYFQALSSKYAISGPSDAGTELLRKIVEVGVKVSADDAISTDGGAPQVGTGGPAVEEKEPPLGTIRPKKTAEETDVQTFIDSDAKRQVSLLREQKGTLSIIDRFFKFLKDSTPTPTEKEIKGRELEAGLRAALFELRKDGITEEEKSIEKDILRDMNKLRQIRLRDIPGFRRTL